MTAALHGSRRRTRRNVHLTTLAKSCAGFVALVVLAALLAGLLLPDGPYDQDLRARLLGPSLNHPLGTDELGRDQLVRLVYGARVSLWAGTIATAVALPLGVFAGLLAGYFGGALDSILSRVFEGILSLPGIILVVAVVSALGPSVTNAMLAVGVVISPRFFRVQRTATLELRAQPFIDACATCGLSTPRIMLGHVLPNTWTPILVQVSSSFAFAVLAEAGISFIGLGARPPTPSWGAMLTKAYENMDAAPHLLFGPGLAIIATILAFTYATDGLSDSLVVGRR